MFDAQPYNSQIYYLNYQLILNQLMQNHIVQNSHLNHFVQEIQVLESKEQGLTFYEYSNLDEENDESCVSIQGPILTEHLQCLEWMVSGLTSSMFKIAQKIDDSIVMNQSMDQSHHTFSNYFSQHQSLIPQPHLLFFLRYLQCHPTLCTFTRWIYEHVHSQLGDELILVVYRIVLAYLPVKSQCLDHSLIHTMSKYTFNLSNIYQHPALKIVGFSQLYKQTSEGVGFNWELHQFHQNFIETTLLVLEQYFQNPLYIKITECKQERKNKIKKYKQSLNRSFTNPIHQNNQP